MISWFLSLDKAAQAALASGVVSSVVVGVIAVLGFWITFKTSTAANERIARVTSDNIFYQMKFSAETRIAEMRQAWIDNLREHVAQFCEDTFKAIPFSNNHEALYKLKIQYIRSYIRLKLNSKEEPHKKLIASMGDVIDIINPLIEQKVNVKTELGPLLNEYHNAIRKLNEVADAVLKEEWTRVKSEIRAVTEELNANQTK